MVGDALEHGGNFAEWHHIVDRRRTAVGTWLDLSYATHWKRPTTQWNLLDGTTTHCFNAHYYRILLN